MIHLSSSFHARLFGGPAGQLWAHRDRDCPERVQHFSNESMIYITVVVLGLFICSLNSLEHLDIRINSCCTTSTRQSICLNRFQSSGCRIFQEALFSGYCDVCAFFRSCVSVHFSSSDIYLNISTSIYEFLLQLHSMSSSIHIHHSQKTCSFV